MVKRKRSRKTCCRKKQKGGFFMGMIKRGFNAAGGIKGKDGKKRKFNLKHNYRNRKKEPLWQKGGTAMPYTNKHGWSGWGNYWFPHQQGGAMKTPSQTEREECVIM